MPAKLGPDVQMFESSGLICSHVCMCEINIFTNPPFEKTVTDSSKEMKNGNKGEKGQEDKSSH